MIGTILWALIGGTVVGLVGKALARGEREVPLWATVLCGIGGVLLGNLVYVDVLGFRAGTFGIDWWRHAWQIAVAAVLVVLADWAFARPRPGRGPRLR